MKQFPSLLIAFVLILGFSSCDQYLDVELPGQGPKLVLDAILENTDTIKVSLTKSRGILEGQEFDQFEGVKNGEVFIRSEDADILPLVFLDKGNSMESFSYYYIAGYDFDPGEKYEIFAESPNLDPVSSQVVFPADVPIKEISYINLGPTGFYENQNLVEFTVKFEDPAALDFYQLDGQIFGKSTIQENHFFSSELYPTPVNPAYEKDYGWGTGFGILFNDVLLRGENAEMVFRTTLPRDYDLEVTINLSHVSESYFRYFDSANLQRFNQGDFLSQPVLVYGNIRNGLGIFSARNRDHEILSITLEE